MKRFFLTVLTGFLLSSAASMLYAGEIDVLLEKLVEKGILTPVEAAIIKDETKQQVAAEVAQGKSYALPDWTQRLKLRGDFRLRHQYERRENDTEARNRGRIRYRLGFDFEVNDEFNVGAGLTSGGADPRSTTQTLENTFDTPDIRLDYAYAQYKSQKIKGLQMIGGKFPFKDYLWVPTDFLWDGDITPEGWSANYERTLLGNVDGFLSTGIWILDENGKTDRPDPFMNYVQGGVKVGEEKWDAKLAATHYAFHGWKGINPDHNSNTNTRVGNVLQHDYDSVGVSGELGFPQPFGGLPLKIDDRIAFLFDFIHNVDPDEQATGWAAGMQWGHAKVKDIGSWDLKYIYAYLGKDAFPDTFPDSDRYAGETAIRGNEVIVQYAVWKNVIFSVDYYLAERIKAARNREHLVQADLSLKF